MIYRGNDKERNGNEINSKEGFEVRGIRLFYLEQLLF